MLLLLNFEIILKIEKDLMLVRIDRMSWSKQRAAVPASFDGALGRVMGAGVTHCAATPERGNERRARGWRGDV